MKIQIKNKWSLKVIFEHECETVKEAVVEANLCGADLCGADLYEANLRGADLCGADLYEANLRGADLYEADLRGANLYGANLYEANLCGADLYEANLRGADLRGANLREANLRGANLYEANLRGAKYKDLTLQGKVVINARLSGLYKYTIDVIKTDKELYIRMGCFFRTAKDWLEDFWNNDGEFPKDSKQGKERLDAFNSVMRFLNLDELKG